MTDVVDFVSLVDVIFLLLTFWKIRVVSCLCNHMAINLFPIFVHNEGLWLVVALQIVLGLLQRAQLTRWLSMKYDYLTKSSHAIHCITNEARINAYMQYMQTDAANLSPCTNTKQHARLARWVTRAYRYRDRIEKMTLSAFSLGTLWEFEWTNGVPHGIAARRTVGKAIICFSQCMVHSPKSISVKGILLRNIKHVQSIDGRWGNSIHPSN